MRPPYDISATILKSVISISEKIGEINAKHLTRQPPRLRKENRIRTIQASLGIEGNTLSEEQITALLEHRRVIGPEKDIREVLNAVKAYEQINTFSFKSEKHFLKAHKLLMDGMIERAGKYRTTRVGIVKGAVVKHLAPSFKNIPFLMKDLFAYMAEREESILIKSCVFHYEMEFIHPFTDGNGRMGRLWQTVCLMSEYPVFEFLPFETLISKNQAGYYKALAESDRDGESTSFIDYMLKIIDQSLKALLQQSAKRLDADDRMNWYLSDTDEDFTRKDYRNKFTELSTATASRDLRKAVEKGIIRKYGDKKTTLYRKK